MGCFDGSMPDLNYGDVATCENNALFKELAASADHWIEMGVDGFRLDAVKHICGGIWSYNNVSNRTFLKKWYDHCNATYKSAGHSDDIFMVGEVWSSHSEEKDYYTGITSCFEFEYWPLLCNALNSKNASSYASTVAGFVSDHTKQRPDAITSLFLTNHDKSSVKYKVINNEQVHFYRAADDLGRDLAKEKQAAAMLLTSAGKPFIYQGEELGYWRNDTNNEDDYLRAPIVWNSGATEVAKGWTNKLDNKMLTGSISVETQEADESSLLNVYKTWSRLRNTYPALASGKMEPLNSGLASVAAWYMTSGDQKLLVIHNVGTSKATLVVPGASDKPVALLGTATLKGSTLSLGANSSVVFEL